LELEINLIIESENSIKVFIDDVFYGMTPLKTNIPLGKHTLRVENTELNIKRTKQINVKEKGENKIYFNF